MPSRAISPDTMELLQSLTPDDRALAEATRKLVLGALPKVTEMTDGKARVLGYGYGPNYRDLVATIILSRQGVKLGIVRGSELPDPGRLLAGKGKAHRYIAFTNPRELWRPGVKVLLAAALAAWRKREGVASK